MTQEEIKKKFDELYDIMANSNDVKKMHIFGKVQKEMMSWLIQNNPDIAKEMLGKLEAVKWNNYLSASEAEKIVSKMKPDAPWAYDQWSDAMKQHELDTDFEPDFNCYALFVVMSMIHSDSIETIKKYIGEGDVFDFIYDLAVDKLTDEDEVFDVRKYFSL